VTNGEFLLDLAERIRMTSEKQGTPRFTSTDHADRLQKIAEQMIKDEKYPAVRP
jgi:hypothetical protein